jgi:hypothetical protein
MRNRTMIKTVCLALFAACGGGSSTAVDAAKDVDAFESDCGHPGDPGNELGIGKFCAFLSDCANTTGAPLCSSLGDKNTHFCTKTCTMGTTTECGTGDNTCSCNTDNPPRCGCTPTVCLGP